MSTLTFKQMKELYAQADAFADDAHIAPKEKRYVFRCSSHGEVKPIIIDSIYHTCPICYEFEIRDCYVPPPVFTKSENNETFIVKSGAYKRIVYFDTLINKLCGHNYIYMDGETRKKIKENIHDVNMASLKAILKDMKLTKYYKCSNALLDSLGGNKKDNIATISQNECNMLKYLFRQIQASYEKYKDANRCNFMSYSFVLQKLFYQIGRADLCHLLPLPKNIFIIYQDELIWASISDELGWDDDFVLF